MRREKNFKTCENAKWQACGGNEVLMRDVPLMNHAALVITSLQAQQTLTRDHCI